MATRTTAPTEEEIRAALARAWATPPPNGSSAGAEFTDAFTHLASLVDAPYDLDDLRESELERLDELIGASMVGVRDQAHRAAIEVLVEAIAAFAAEHPEAPRRRTLVEA
jgi:hypothetical protein